MGPLGGLHRKTVAAKANGADQAAVGFVHKQPRSFANIATRIRAKRGLTVADVAHATCLSTRLLGTVTAGNGSGNAPLMTRQRKSSHPLLRLPLNGRDLNRRTLPGEHLVLDRSASLTGQPV